MQYLFDNIKCLQKKLQNKKLLLFLDYDGTLAKIVEHYQSATILAKSKMLLKQIIRDPHCRVTIVSGRSLADVKRRVGLKNTIYVGNHGLEVSGPKIRYKLFVAVDTKNVLKKIKACFVERLGQMSGVLIEDKDLTLSIHYRKVERKELGSFKKILFQSVQPYLRNHKVTLNNGKKVFEIKPAVDWNKGSVVSWLIKRLQGPAHNKRGFPIFIGDDVTDETAFSALKNKGLCIRVGQKGVSAAQYYVKNVDQVAEFLKIVLSLKNDRRAYQGAKA